MEKLISLLIISVTLNGCLNGRQDSINSRSRNLAGSQPTATPELFSNEVPERIPESIYWVSNRSLGQSLTIDQKIRTVAFMHGRPINNYLLDQSNFNKQFCLVLDFSVNGQKQLRVRAVPIIIINSNNRRERVLRVDFYTRADNAANCSGNIASPNPATISYHPEEICPECGTVHLSGETRMYTSVGGQINQTTLFPQNTINFTTMNVRINPGNNTIIQNNSCTPESCVASGFQCCLDGQCVNDGEERPDAASNSHYAQAISDIMKSPANFINYPEIFFICPSTIAPTPTPTSVPDLEATSTANLEQMKEYFFCLKFAEQETPDYSYCFPTQNETAYNTIKNTIWTTCQCATVGTPAPEDPSSTCPNYGLLPYSKEGTVIEEPEVDTSGDILSVQCLAPNDAFPTPFQDLSVSVPARSAPHRFFRATDGQWQEDISKLFGTPEGVPISEGTEFFYTDEINKVRPQAVDLNMNAILGQFKVDLTRALPATVVKLNFGLVYIISTVQGTYTPCPQCAKDQWFSNFTAFPASDFGTGLQAVGFSTKRDDFVFNTSNGNYEDTIFGRACWIPPTMIPHSHVASSDGNIITQRTTRLKTQAAWWMNGYQRDWYGFNRGALIGSFDGVSWFSIGKDRRVVATSDKLFLAFNAPFADLAEPADLIVSVVQDEDGTSPVPLVDYDPDLDLVNTLQNQGASCQLYHICDTDRDCITRLGWEYVCAATTSFRTLWPRFNTSAEEQVDTQLVGSYATMIHGDFPSAGVKRCVYRGAGALCRRDYFQITDVNRRAMAACAPNFYCASISGTAFNREIAREPLPDIRLLFGQEADYLGRPKDYVGAANPLPDDVRTTIEANALVNGASTTSQVGMCRPGTSLTFTNTLPNPVRRHNSQDISKRTDYINQIASCNPITSFTDNTNIERLHSCPILDDDGNYFYTKLTSIPTIDGNFNNLTDADLILEIFRKLKAQNACGGESLSNEGANPFNSIEALSPALQGNFESPGILFNGCLRRAGATCHTNLNCSPNILHAQQAELFGVSFFGFTQAEKNYWLEYLVCDQAVERPNTLADTLSTSYNFSLNRCCRARGNDITIYTQGDPETFNENQPFTTDGSIVDINPTAAFENPGAQGRYSRWSSLGEILVVTPLPLGFSQTALTSATPVYPKMDYSNLGVAGATPVPSPPVPYQWKAISDVASKTCCGGGWIRKFRDNSNDWSIYNRLTLNILNFQCINFRTRFITERPPNLLSTNPNYDQEGDILCRDPKFGGCVQFNMARASDVTDVVPPTDIHDVFINGPQGLRNTNTNRLICPTPNGTTSCNTFAAGHETCNDDTNTTTNCHSLNRAAYPYQITIVDTDTRQQVQNDLAPYNPRFITPDDLPVVLGVPTPVSFATHMSLDGLLGNGVHILGFRLPAYVNGIHNVRALRLVKRSKDPNDDGFHEYDLGNGFSQTTSSNLGANYRDYDINDFNPANAQVHVLNHDTDNNWYTHCVDGGNLDTLDRPPLCICPISDMPAGCTPQTCPGNYGKITQAAGEQAGTVPVADQTRGWCYEPETGLMWVKIKNCDLLPDNGACTGAGSVAPYSTAETAEPWEARFTVALEFYPMGTAGHCYDNDACRDPTPAATPVPLFWASHNFRGDKLGLTPGNDMYYLQALSRFELMGIPQIAYQPLLCSWDRNELVPGLYDSTDITTFAQFITNASFGFLEGDSVSPNPFPVYPTAAVTSADASQPAVYHTDISGVEKIQLDPVFDNNKFLCCQVLGQKTSDPDNCCSGHGVLDSTDNKFTCKLRLRTNLNLYFNKFISNEGGHELIDDANKLLDSDYDPLTGEPLPLVSVYNKIIALGREHCDTTGVFTGAAFGQYLLSVADGKPVFETLTTEDLPYGIVFEVTAGQQVDGNGDNDIEGEKGSLRFNEGRRWNHHIYCGDQP